MLGARDELTGTEDVPVQLIATTHSPMVLASLEPIFDEEQDALWSLDLVDDEVELHREPWRRRGDANTWLTSSSLDLAEPRSLEAERAIRRANELGKQAHPEPEEVERVEAELRTVLGNSAIRARFPAGACRPTGGVACPSSTRATKACAPTSPW